MSVLRTALGPTNGARVDTFEERELVTAARSTRALVTRVAELVAERRWEEIPALLHPDAKLVVADGSGRLRPLRTEAFRRWLRQEGAGDWCRRLEARVASIEVLERDLAIATGTLRVPLRRGGHVLTQTTWVVVIRDGLVFRVDRRATVAEARALARGYTLEEKDGGPPDP